MGTEIVPFDFHGHTVRVCRFPDHEEWIAKDACDALDIRGNAPLSGLDDDEKRSCIVGTPGGPQEMATVTEAGLYKLVLRSRKPAAKDFVRWLTHEVLPKIRRTGFYVADGDEARALAVLDRILLHKAMTWEAMFSYDVPRALAPIYGRQVDPEHYPVWMGRITHKIYDLLFGEDTMDEARERRGPHTGKGNLLHQFLTPDARTYLRDHIHVVMALAKTSATPDDFWGKVAAVFGKSMTQLRLLADASTCPACGSPAVDGARFCAQCGARLATA